MALLITLETDFGETRELYVRVNNIDQLTNHAEAGPDRVRFRGYIGRDAFEARKAFVWELVLPCPIDVADAAWPQAYAALRAYDPTAAIAPPIDARERVPDGAPQATIDAAEAEWAQAKAEHDARTATAAALRSALAAARDV